MRVLIVFLLFVMLCCCVSCGGSAVRSDPIGEPVAGGRAELPDVGSLPKVVSAQHEQLDFTAPLASSDGFVVGQLGGVDTGAVVAEDGTEWAVFAVGGYGPDRLPRTLVLDFSPIQPHDGEVFLGFADQRRQTWVWQEFLLSEWHSYRPLHVPPEGDFSDPSSGVAMVAIVVQGRLQLMLHEGWLLAGSPGKVLPMSYTVARDNPAQLLADYEVIGGSLTIEADAGSLAGLDGIHFIGGDLIVEATGGIDSLTGLEHLSDLETVGGSLRIVGVASLIDVELPELATVGGSVGISDNARLRSVRLPRLADVGRQARALHTHGCGFADNEVLAELELPALQTVNYGSFDVCYLTQLDEVPADPPIAAIALPQLRRADYLVRFCGMPHLETVSMPRLASAHSLELTDLDSLTEVDIGAVAELADVRLRRLGSLTTLESLGGLRDVRNLYIRDDPLLTDLDGLAGLRRVGSTIWLERNNALASLTGLRYLEPDPGSGLICRSLLVRYNQSLPDGDQTVWDLIDALGGQSMFEVLTIHDNGGAAEPVN